MQRCASPPLPAHVRPASYHPAPATAPRSGAARFEDILLGDAQLHAAAVEAGVFSWGTWAVQAPGGGYTLLDGGRAMALPVTLRSAPPQTVALLLACVWHEANRAEALAHATYTFAAGGERVTGAPSLLLAVRLHGGTCRAGRCPHAFCNRVAAAVVGPGVVPFLA